MKIKRIWVSIAIIILVLFVYEVRLKPQSRPLYERALALYRAQHYELSLLQLETAYAIEPNSTAILTLRGWNHLKTRRFKEAREDFSRASRLDSSLIEPKLGLVYVALETGEGEAPVEGAVALLELDPSNRDFALATAVALRKAGDNVQAVKLFKGLLRDSQYGSLAREHIDQIYGIAGMTEAIPDGLPAFQRPSKKQVLFRAAGRSLQVQGQRGWEDFYVKGVNLGPAIPGLFATEPPQAMQVYSQWLRQMAELGANTIRVHSLLPPAFYRALRRHNTNSGLPRIYLLQQVWMVEPSQLNLYDRAIEEAARKEVERAIDAIHGQGNVPMRTGYSSGLYIEDVSEYTLGLLIGRELEPHLVLANNNFNSARRNHAGKFISVPEGNATEVWLGRMLDHAAAYEMEKYNAQRPLAVVNWAPLDPLHHPTEAPLQDEMNFRRRAGERVEPLPDSYDDDDVASVDETKFQVASEFEPGIFVSYPIFPYYPEFMLHEPSLLAARDPQGPSPFLGYLLALKTYYARLPLLVAEYGASTSIGVSHLHPQGWHQGGHSEAQQAQFLARMTRTIFDAGVAGGLVSEWQDQWSKSNWLVAPFEVPAERRAFWFNAMNPQESLGLFSYDTSRVNLFSADSSGWKEVKALREKASPAPSVALGDGGDVQRTLRSLSAGSDEGFLYLRLAVRSLPRDRDGNPQFNLANYVIGISTLPGRFGSRTVPGFAPRLQVSQGVNFLLHIGGVDNTRLLIASNYSPQSLVTAPGTSGRTLIGRRRPWNPALEQWAGFEEIVLEPNRLRYSRDGTAFPAQRYSASALRYGSPDPKSPRYDSSATWAADFGGNALIVRIPWSLLYVTDPSSRQVYAGTADDGTVVTAETPGLAMFAFSFRPGGARPEWNRLPTVALAATDFLPAPDNRLVFGALPSYEWEAWNSIKLTGRLKPAAGMLTKTWQELKSR